MLGLSPSRGMRPAKIWVGTYDLNGTPISNRDVPQLSRWFYALQIARYDIVVVSIQGIPDSKSTARPQSRGLAPEGLVKLCLDLTRDTGKPAKVTADSGYEYRLLSSCQESGTYLMVFVNSWIGLRITDVETTTMVLRRSAFSEKRAAVSIRAAFNGTTICFVASKLTGGFADYDERNKEYASITETLRFRSDRRGINDHDAVLWAGNLNYCIGLSENRVVNTIMASEDGNPEALEMLCENDQLNLQMAAGLAFPAYIEPYIKFAPTATFKPGSDAYEVGSIPAWTGRVLFKAPQAKAISYGSVQEVRISDQRPVYAALALEVPSLGEPPATPEHQADALLAKDKPAFSSPEPLSSQLVTPLVPPGKPIRVDNWSPDKSLKKTHDFLHVMRDGKYWQSKEHRRRTRVAILDSGIDMTHPEIAARSDRIADTFCPIPGLEKQANQDRGGHGTHITLLLLQVAPMVDVYVCRVFEDTKRVVSDYVGDAILHAVNEWHVDIILMSFGFNLWVPSISRAIRVAAFSNVLMFAAASNEGANADMRLAYPARETTVFDIRATDHLGNKCKYNPPCQAGERWKFATLGENVLSAWTEGQMLAKSGTSMAAAIAAGSAALLLDFSRLPTFRGQTSRHLEYMSSFDGMGVLLEASSAKTTEGLLYIKPWLLFSKKGFKRDRLTNYIADILDEHFGWEDS